MGEPLRTGRRSRNVVDEVGVECVPYVIVAVAIVTLDVSAVLWKYVSPLRTFIEAMAPGIRSLRAKAMPTAQAYDGLQGVVVGVADTGCFVDRSIVWKRCIIRAAALLRKRVNVGSVCAEGWLIDV